MSSVTERSKRRRRGGDGEHVMAMYADEEEAWKCPKHPSRRRRSGICPTCLKDRLNTLCPECANLRPCACCASTATSSSRFSSFFSSATGGTGTDSDASLRRSRSVAVSMFRSRVESVPGSSRTSAFWRVFKSKRSGGAIEDAASCNGAELKFQTNEPAAGGMKATEEWSGMMRKSRSVAVVSNYGGGDDGRKGRGWHFPSPIKAFRQSKAAVAQERSPLYCTNPRG